jgi:hypothetical protein
MNEHVPVVMHNMDMDRRSRAGRQGGNSIKPMYPTVLLVGIDSVGEQRELYFGPYKIETGAGHFRPHAGGEKLKSNFGGQFSDSICATDMEQGPPICYFCQIVSPFYM